MSAAAVLVFCLVGFWLFPRLSKRQEDGASPQWLSWHNGPGRHGAVTLPDSSRVYVGPASTLWYRQSNDHGRLVRLEGEAYFIVRHDPKRAFTVETGALNTVDVGTEFNISRREPQTTVTVRRGVVEVRPKADDRVVDRLTAGRQLTAVDNGLAQVEPVDPEQAFAWREGR